MYLNNGDGSFLDATFPRLAERDGRSTNAEFGEVDGDGDGDGVVDLVVGNSGGINQPDLPPPDDAERLFLVQDCISSITLCHQTMLDGLFSTIAELNTAPFPDNDMSSQSERLNTYRQRVLGFSTTLAARALDVEKARSYGQLVWYIDQRADGLHDPRDWVIGDSANVIRGYNQFSLQLLYEVGL